MFFLHLLTYNQMVRQQNMSFISNTVRHNRVVIFCCSGSIQADSLHAMLNARFDKVFVVDIRCRVALSDALHRYTRKHTLLPVVFIKGQLIRDVRDTVRYMHGA